MPTAGGPNTLGESNLVFAYDTSDVKNSYKGEPTVNLITNADTMASWTTYYRTVTLTSFITEFGTTGYRFASQPSWNGIYKNFNLGSAGFYTFSAWFKYSGGSVNNNGATVYISNYGGGDTAAALDKTKVGIWQRVSFTVNVTSPSNVYFFLISFGGTDNGTGNPDFSSWEVTMPQIEPLSHSTPFVNGTRSVTQGLLPLVGNSTINLSNVSFDSNAQMVFDGTNDYVNLGSYLHNMDTSTLSIEIVFKTNVVTGNALILLGWHENEYPHGYICLGNFTGHWGNETISFYNEGPGTTALSFAYTNGHSLLSDTLYHHVVFILQTNNYKIYIDGVEVAVNASFRNGSQSTVMPSNLFGYGTTPSVVLGAGSSPANSFFNGNIPITKIYNRALTAQEVKQNYQQYKTRFNLS